MLDSALYMSYANDVAMQIDGRIVVLIEHQSTINRNMPLRLLDYITRIYEKVVPSRKKFARAVVKIPAPEFYVLYNGRDDFPAESEMRLSDAFIYPEGEDKPEHVPLELVVKVYNINLGKGDKLLAKCETLRQYSAFIELVRYAHSNAEQEHIEKPLDWAVKEAIRQGILPEYLERKASEVRNMLNMEYDYEIDKEVQREEALEEGMKKGVEEGLEKGIAQSLAKLMASLKIPLAQAMSILGIQTAEQGKFASMIAEMSV